MSTAGAQLKLTQRYPLSWWLRSEADFAWCRGLVEGGDHWFFLSVEELWCLFERPTASRQSFKKNRPAKSTAWKAGRPTG